MWTVSWAKQLPEAASIAKAYCSDAYFFNAGCGIQLFGGVGFTSEYDIQLYFKRAKSTETFLGNAEYHRERLAASCWMGRLPDEVEFSAQDEQFREEVATWLRENLCGEFEVIRGRGGPGDEHMYVQERRDWEK